jgi:putative transcriptional regulator
MTSKGRKPLFERLKIGLAEGIAYSQGALNLKTVEVPDEPPEIDAKTLAALRAQTAMSQAVFAKLLNVSAKTVQSWEQGLRRPSQASRRLIQVLSERADVLWQIVGLSGGKLKGVKIVGTGTGRRKIVVSPLRRRPRKPAPLKK